MRVSQIRTALCVVRYRSFSAAATALGLSRSAVCRSIEAMEAELGTPLFNLERKGEIALTDAGMECLSHMYGLEEAYSNMFGAALAPGVERCDLNIGYIDAIALGVQDTILTEFVATHGYLRLELKAQPQIVLVQSVLSGLFDVGLAFTGGPFSTAAGMMRSFGYPELRLTELRRGPITLLFGSRHRFASLAGSKGCVEMGDLEGVTMYFKEVIGNQVDITTAFLNICNSCGVHPDFKRLSVNRGNNMFGLLSSEGGGVVASLLPLKTLPEGIMQLPLAYPLMDVSFTAVSRRDNDSEMLKIFLRYLRAAGKAAGTEGK